MEANGKIILHAVGDVSPRRIDYEEAPESLFARVADKIQEADISLISHELESDRDLCTGQNQVSEYLAH